jgi:hypothetical protein
MYILNVEYRNEPKAKQTHRLRGYNLHPTIPGVDSIASSYVDISRLQYLSSKYSGRACDRLASPI